MLSFTVTTLEAGVKTDESHEKAMQLLNKAIALDKAYHQAVFLRFKVESILAQSSHETQIESLEQYFVTQIESCDDISLFADYYQTKGFVCRQNGFYQEAIDALSKSQELQYDIINEVNMALTYYSWAADGYPKNEYFVRLPIDQPKLITSFQGI